MDTARIEKEFPQILNIHDSLKKYVFEPNAAKRPEVLAAVKEMRGR
jgi:3,5-epimerase/4-reductase